MGRPAEQVEGTEEEEVNHLPHIYRPKGIKIEDILELQERNPNMTHKEMGALLGCDRSNVSQRLSEYKPVVESLDRYRKHEGKVLATIRKRVSDSLQDLTPEDLKASSLRDRVVAYGILYDKGRLEEGKSTSNVSLAEAALSLSEGLAGLEKELSSLPPEE